jgi:predicted transcriptional regulator
MVKNRDNLELAVDILKAACGGSGKTRIMNSANLSFALLEKYLKIVLDAGFLQVNDSIYQVTEKGQIFIEKYDELNQRNLEAQKLTKKLYIEREEMKHSLLNEICPLNEQNESDIRLDKEASKAYCAFQRIDGTKFYGELQTLGFKPEEAIQIVSWVDIINSSRPIFFSGKKPSLIKANLAYTGARIFSTPRTLTQHTIAKYYRTSVNSIQRLFKDYLTILYEEKPDVFKLRTTNSKKLSKNNPS